MLLNGHYNLIVITYQLNGGGIPKKVNLKRYDCPVPTSKSGGTNKHFCSQEAKGNLTSKDHHNFIDHHRDHHRPSHCHLFFDEIHCNVLSIGFK